MERRSLEQEKEASNIEGISHFSRKGTDFIVIPQEMRLARCHFEIIRIPDEQDESHYFIRDLDSHCGIYLNGQKGIGTSENWAPLQHGDRILFDFEFSFSDLSGTIPKAGFSYKNSFIIAER